MGVTGVSQDADDLEARQGGDLSAELSGHVWLNPGPVHARVDLQ